MSITFEELRNCLNEVAEIMKQTSEQLEAQSLRAEQLELIRQQHDSQIADFNAKLLTQQTPLSNRQTIAQRVIGVALCFDMLDVQYKFGGEWENDKAFDCSAFMQICFRVGTQGKVKLPRTSHDQSLVGSNVPLDKMEPGDTLHYDFDGDGKITHVSLYMGDGWMIHTNNTELDINIIKVSDYNKGKGLVKVRRHIVQ